MKLLEDLLSGRDDRYITKQKQIITQAFSYKRCAQSKKTTSEFTIVVFYKNTKIQNGTVRPHNNTHASHLFIISTRRVRGHQTISPNIYIEQFHSNKR